MADGRGVTAALDFLQAAAFPVREVSDEPRPPLRLVPADAIPLQISPAVTISLTDGCDLPLEALCTAPERTVSCHPCDEAVVTLLLTRVRRPELPFTTSPDVSPGTLRIG